MQLALVKYGIVQTIVEANAEFVQANKDNWQAIVDVTNANPEIKIGYQYEGGKFLLSNAKTIPLMVL